MVLFVLAPDGSLNHFQIWIRIGCVCDRSGRDVSLASDDRAGNYCCSSPETSSPGWTEGIEARRNKASQAGHLTHSGHILRIGVGPTLPTEMSMVVQPFASEYSVDVVNVIYIVESLLGTGNLLSDCCASITGWSLSLLILLVQRESDSCTVWNIFYIHSIGVWQNMACITPYDTMPVIERGDIVFNRPTSLGSCSL